jgi:hypothetical protein
MSGAAAPNKDEIAKEPNQMFSDSRGNLAKQPVVKSWTQAGNARSDNPPQSSSTQAKGKKDDPVGNNI